MRLHRLVLSGLLLSAPLLVLPTAGSAAAKSAAKAKKPACALKHAETLATSRYGRLLATHAEDDELYGESTELYACRTGYRPVLLIATEPGDSIDPSHVVFAAKYVGFSTSFYSSSCSKYQPGGAECSGLGVSSYNTRTGDVRTTTSTPAAVDALAVSAQGWLAWVTPAAADGSRTVVARNRLERVLAQGSISPTSLKASAGTLRWTRDGKPESAPF